MIKPQKNRNREKFLQFDKNQTANIVLMVKTESLPDKIGNKTEMFTFISFIQHIAGSSSQCNQTKKEVEGIQIGKDERI